MLPQAVAPASSEHVQSMSALPPKADMDQHGLDVRFVPKAEICSAAKISLFDDSEKRDENAASHLQPLRLSSQRCIGALEDAECGSGPACAVRRALAYRNKCLSQNNKIS